MVEQDECCTGAPTQAAAAAKALQAVGLLEDHMIHGVLHAAQSNQAEGQGKIAEASAAIAHLVGSQANRPPLQEHK